MLASLAARRCLRPRTAAERLYALSGVRIRRLPLVSTAALHTSSRCWAEARKRRKKLSLDDIGKEAFEVPVEPLLPARTATSAEPHIELQAIQEHQTGVPTEETPADTTATTAEELVEQRPVPGTKLLRMVREYQLRHPDWLLLTRVGEFYEAYYEQADQLGAMLDIMVVTRMFKKQPTRFTGFPVRYLERNLQRMVRDYGRTVALCEQFKDPHCYRFERRIERVVSPGTLIGESFLDFQEHNYLLAIMEDTETTVASGEEGATRLGLSWIDLSTGDFHVKEATLEELETDLARIRPREILLEERWRSHAEHPVMQLIERDRYTTLSYLPASSREERVTHLRRLIKQTASVSQLIGSSGGSGRFASTLQLEDYTHHERIAIAHIAAYIEQTQAGRDITLRMPVRYDTTTTMRIDRSAIQSLELVRVMGENKRQGSLLHTIDRTITKAGARLLYLRMGK